MIASLAMYDFPWLRDANDRLWTAIASRLRAAGIEGVPSGLSRGIDLDDVWRSPDLLLGQTCGYPLMTELRETVQVVATPVYRAAGCQDATHRSAIIVRSDDKAASLDDLRGRRVALNSPRSNTGMNLLRAAIALHAGRGRFFDAVLPTGSHARSIAAVLSGRADVAAIDAVSLGHLQGRYPDYARHIQVFAWTSPTPGLPLVTSAHTPPDVIQSLRDALSAVVASGEAEDSLAALHVERFDVLDIDAYAAIIDLEDLALERGYPVLH